MIGQLGSIYLAAASISSSIFTACSIFPRGVSYGLTALIAPAHAKKQDTEIVQLFKHALYLNLALGLVFVGILYLCGTMMPYLKQDPQVIKLAIPYLQIISISLIPMIIFNTFARYLEGVARTKPLMLISIIGTLAHILLNYVLIYGKWGLPNLALHGAGWATLISRIGMMIAAGFYIFLYGDLTMSDLKFKLSQFNHLYFLNLLKIGLPVGLHLSLEMIAFSVMTIMVGWLGTDQQAANAIVANVIDVLLGITWSISIAASVLVGKAFSTGDTQKTREVGMIGLVFGLCISSVLSAVLIYMSPPIFRLYSNDSAVIAIAHRLVLISALFNVVDCVYTLGMSQLRGMQDTLKPVIISNTSNWFIGLPLAYVLAFKLEWLAAGIWWGKTIAFSISAFSFFLRFYLKTKTKQV